MKFPLLLMFTGLLSGVVCCRSVDKRKETAETREMTRLGARDMEAEPGGYYRLRRTMTGFYFDKPVFTQVLPNRFLAYGHIVQLLDPSAGDGWARVKNEQMQVGYVQFEDIKIVPPEKQPKPKRRGMDDELNQMMLEE